VVPYQIKLLHAVTVVSPALLLLIVRCKVTTESQPATVENVCVGVPLVVYVVPYQVKLLHAVTVVSPVLLLLMVRCKVTTESHPATVENVCVDVPEVV